VPEFDPWAGSGSASNRPAFKILLAVAKTLPKRTFLTARYHSELVFKIGATAIIETLNQLLLP